VLAIDLENPEVARDLALRAGDQPGAHATLGLLSLDGAEIETAEGQFDRALQQKPDLARAWIGKGLVAMARNTPQEALKPLQRGAEIFGDHLGSWIALGWAELLSGDQAGAERTFHHALDLDRNFAESHGSLAVIEALKGNFDTARRGVETAMRLDSSSFAAVFASVLIASAQGKEDAAQRIFDRALDTPIQADGPSLRDMISQFARSS
jgi:Tfp pilus assembly protein PilF